MARPWQLDCDMPSVRMYLKKTHTVPIPELFFTKPLQSHLYTVVRPMAKNQKYRSSTCAYPFPVQVWQDWSSRLPGDEPTLKMKRSNTYEGHQGFLKATTTTSTKEEWEYTIPAGRTAIMDNICEFESHNSRRGMGAAKLNMPSKRAQKEKGATARSMSMACGPTWLKMSSPTSAEARKKGRIGTIRCKIWCGKLLFDDQLTFTFPEQSGSKSRAANKYTSRQKAAIRRGALCNLDRMLKDPKYPLDRDYLRPLVDAALVSTHPYPNPSLHQLIPTSTSLSTPNHPYPNPPLPQPIPTPTHPYPNPSLPQPIPTPTACSPPTHYTPCNPPLPKLPAPRTRPYRPHAPEDASSSTPCRNRHSECIPPHIYTYLQ